MAILDTVRDAIMGNPPSVATLPSREGMIKAFEEFYAYVSGAIVGFTSYETKELMDAVVDADDGTQARVWGDANPANNAIWISNGGVWAKDTDFYNQIAAVVQPLVDDAEAAQQAAEDAVILAQAAAVTAQTEAASFRMPRGFPTADLQAFWAFDEGGGNTVTNVFDPGTLDIDLTLPTDPNFEWTGYGGKTTAGLVQSSVITGSRTVMMVYKAVRDSTSGMTLAGGYNPGAGISGQSLQFNYDFWIGNGWGVHVPFRRTDGASAYEANRGGWIVAFMEYDQAYDSAIGIGGEIGTTSQRTSETHVACAAVWDATLNDAQRAAAYESLRPFLLKKGIVLNWQDGNGHYDGVALAGESNPFGSGRIDELTASDQTARYIGTLIQSGNGPTAFASPQPFAIGINNQQPSSGINVGYEIGLAASKLADMIRSRRDMVVIKTASGGSHLAPASTGAAGVWNASDLPGESLFYSMLRDVYDAEQWARLNGKGLDLIGIQFGIGINDGTNPAYASSSAVYQGYLQDFYDTFLEYTGLLSIKIHIPRAHNLSPSSDATAISNVRAGQAAFVTALGAGVAKLLDTDAIPLRADDTHYTGPGCKTIGADAYSFFFP